MTIVWMISIWVLIGLVLYWVEVYSIFLLLIMLLYLLSFVGQVYLLFPSRWEKLKEKFKFEFSQTKRVTLALVILGVQLAAPIFFMIKVSQEAQEITAGSKDFFDSTFKLTAALGEKTIKHAIRNDLEKISKIQEVSPKEVIKGTTDEQKQAVLDFEKKFFEATVKEQFAQKSKDEETKVLNYTAQIQKLEAIAIPRNLPEKVSGLLLEAKNNYIKHLEANVKRETLLKNKQNNSEQKFLSTKHFVRNLVYPLLEPAMARAKIIRAEKIMGIDENRIGQYVPVFDTEKIKKHNFLEGFFGDKPEDKAQKPIAPAQAL